MQKRFDIYYKVVTIFFSGATHTDYTLNMAESRCLQAHFSEKRDVYKVVIVPPDLPKYRKSDDRATASP